jgi:hypothetical protein
MALDATANFSKVTVSTGYTSTDTSIVLNTGDGVKIPAPPVNATWWNSTDYPDPSDDPDVEIVRITTVSTDTLTVTRAQEGTTATNKNISGKIYKMICGATSKTITDIGNLLATISTFKLTATGTVNGSNAAFTFTQEPSVIVSDGAIYPQGVGWSWNATTLTATMTIPPSSFIFGWT